MKRLIWVTLLALLAAIGPARADGIRVIDGDTIAITKEAKAGFLGIGSTPGEKFSCRLIGIDTPELRGKCPQEKELAKKAQLKVMSLLSVGSVDIVRAKNRDKFGRELCRVSVDGVDVARVLINDGLARSYDGKTARRPWC